LFLGGVGKANTARGGDRGGGEKAKAAGKKARARTMPSTFNSSSIVSASALSVALAAHATKRCCCWWWWWCCCCCGCDCEWRGAAAEEEAATAATPARRGATEGITPAALTRCCCWCAAALKEEAFKPERDAIARRLDAAFWERKDACADLSVRFHSRFDGQILNCISRIEHANGPAYRPGHPWWGKETLPAGALCLTLVFPL
jgi:hypothetical protein